MAVLARHSARFDLLQVRFDLVTGKHLAVAGLRTVQVSLHTCLYIRDSPMCVTLCMTAYCCYILAHAEWCKLPKLLPVFPSQFNIRTVVKVKSNHKMFWQSTRCMPKWAYTGSALAKQYT